VAAVTMCSPGANLGQPPSKAFHASASNLLQVRAIGPRRTLNQRVGGSSPPRLTTFLNVYASFVMVASFGSPMGTSGAMWVLFLGGGGDSWSSSRRARRSGKGSAQSKSGNAASSNMQGQNPKVAGLRETCSPPIAVNLKLLSGRGMEGELRNFRPREYVGFYKRVSMGRKIWKVTKRVVLCLLALLLVLASSGFAYRAYRHHKIGKATVIDTTKGIDEGLFVKIGGIDQWITIRGQDRDNPVLLLLHGGPGVATSPYPRNALFDWTRDFTFVQWDQRGSGKTYGKSGPLGADDTIDRMTQDGVEVAEFLRQHLHKPKIILLGLSWDSILGIHMAKMRPDMFYAYVGTGQMVSEPEAEPLDYQQVVTKARERNDRRAIAELTRIGPPPYATQADLGGQRKWARAYETGADTNGHILYMALFESEDSFRDLKNYAAGIVDSQNQFFGQDMSGPLAKLDLRELGSDFGIPVFVFQGADDDIAPAQLARAYVDSLDAPQKQFVAIEGAGHTVMYTKSDEFLTLLVERVRPLAM